MSYLALYREWRPKTFDEVVEQKQAVYALRQAVISRQIGHAYLFSGTRGTGKTTLAKIFSRAINCLDPKDGNPCNQCEICRGVLDGSLLDVVEMDAASNNSVENVRRITDEVNFMPSKAHYKVYIIDEVHMLTTGAFNALLKTLEEPPAHAVFILATTEPHRIPATILSRCQRYDFRRIPVESITARLAEIARADGITIDARGLETIASFADGALRDAISLLDQAKMSIAGIIGRDDVLALAGLTKDDALLALADALIRSDAMTVLDLIDQLIMAGRDLSRLIPDLAQLFRNILICQVSDHPEKLVQTTAEGLVTLQQLAGLSNTQMTMAWVRGLSAMLSELRWAADTRTTLEVGLIRLMSEGTVEAIVSRLVLPKAAVSRPIIQAETPVTKPIAPPQPVEPAPALAESDDVPFPDEAPPIDESETRLPAPPAATPVLTPKPDLTPNTASDPFSTVKPSVAASEVVDLWPKVLNSLSETGQMTLFLFGRSARAQQIRAGVVQIVFSKSEKVHSDEFKTPAAQKVLREILQSITGLVMEIQIVLEGDLEAANLSGAKQNPSEPAQPEWIAKLQNTADQFGIPMTVED